MKLSALYWHRFTPLHIILWPISLCYELFLTIQKFCYWLDIFQTVKLPVSVISVDSISVENSGKTSLILWLVDSLIKNGYTPGIVTRGNLITGTPIEATHLVENMDGNTRLFVHRFGADCPVWMGNDRIKTAQALLQANPECNILIFNDALQFHRLERDIEITLVDFSEESYGNGLLLPAGPLRANPRKLSENTLIIASDEKNFSLITQHWHKRYPFKSVTEIAYNLLKPEDRQPLSHFKNTRVHMITDADDEEWMFVAAQKAELSSDTAFHSFSENHRFVSKDIDFPQGDIVVLSEKNALQCLNFASEALWAIPQEVWVDNQLEDAILKQLSSKPEILPSA